MVQPLFLKFLVVIPCVCHNYIAHIPENFTLLLDVSATTLVHSVMGQLTTNATPIPHLSTHTKQRIYSPIPEIFHPNLPPIPRLSTKNLLPIPEIFHPNLPPITRPHSISSNLSDRILTADCQSTEAYYDQHPQNQAPRYISAKDWESKLCIRGFQGRNAA